MVLLEMNWGFALELWANNHFNEYVGTVLFKKMALYVCHVKLGFGS